MRKVIAAFNTSIDGNIDHTAGVADEELHSHYADLLNDAAVILYGRKTYQLMQYWQSLLQDPSGERARDDFARAIDNVHKIVFSNTLSETGWDSATIAMESLESTIARLKQLPGKDIYIGSHSLIEQLINAGLVDQLQLCIQPVIAGKGIDLFAHVRVRTRLMLKKTRIFDNGAIILYYEPIKEQPIAKLP